MTPGFLSGTFEPDSPGHAGHDRGPHGPSRFAQAPRRTQAAPLQSPEQPDTQSGAQFTPPARGPHNEDGEVQSSSRQQANSAEPAVSAGGTSERRAIVDRECARLEQEGAPEGTRWAVPCSCLMPWSCVPCPAEGHQVGSAHYRPAQASPQAALASCTTRSPLPWCQNQATGTKLLLSLHGIKGCCNSLWA